MIRCRRKPPQCLSDTVAILYKLQEQSLSAGAVCLLKYAGICPAALPENVKASHCCWNLSNGAQHRNSVSGYSIFEWGSVQLKLPMKSLLKNWEECTYFFTGHFLVNQFIYCRPSVALRLLLQSQQEQQLSCSVSVSYWIIFLFCINQNITCLWNTETIQRDLQGLKWVYLFEIENKN